MPPRDYDRPDGYDDDFIPYGTEPDHVTEEFGSSEPLLEEDLANLHYDAYGIPIGPRRVLPVEEEPSALVARYLFPTEKFRGEWRKHWTYLFDQFTYAVLATVFFGWLWGVLAKHHQTGLTMAAIFLWIAVMIFVGWRIGDWYFNRFILTNKRIMLVSGMITRTVGMMPLLRVTDMKYEQSPLGRIFNYGNFLLESAGQDQALREVKHLPNPNELYLRIVEEMYEPEAVEAKLMRESMEDGT